MTTEISLNNITNKLDHSFTRQQLQELMGTTKSSATRYIEKLITANAVTLRGSGKATTYHIIRMDL